MIGEGLKPFTSSHTPSESSRAATGITGSTASPVSEECCPDSVAKTAMMSRGPPVSPITGMMRGTRRERYIKVPSSSALKTVTLYAFFGYCLLVIAAILALRVLVLVFRPDTR